MHLRFWKEKKQGKLQTEGRRRKKSSETVRGAVLRKESWLGKISKPEGRKVITTPQLAKKKEQGLPKSKRKPRNQEEKENARGEEKKATGEPDLSLVCTAREMRSGPPKGGKNLRKRFSRERAGKKKRGGPRKGTSSRVPRNLQLIQKEERLPREEGRREEPEKGSDLIPKRLQIRDFSAPGTTSFVDLKDT